MSANSLFVAISPFPQFPPWRAINASLATDTVKAFSSFGLAAHASAAEITTVASSFHCPVRGRTARAADIAARIKSKGLAPRLIAFSIIVMASGSKGGKFVSDPLKTPPPAWAVVSGSAKGSHTTFAIEANHHQAGRHKVLMSFRVVIIITSVFIFRFWLVPCGHHWFRIVQ